VTSGETGSDPLKYFDRAEGTGMRGEPRRRARFMFMFMPSVLGLSSSALPPKTQEDLEMVKESRSSRNVAIVPTANRPSQPRRAMDE
jgi:hypothetical protein